MLKCARVHCLEVKECYNQTVAFYMLRVFGLNAFFVIMHLISYTYAYMKFLVLIQPASCFLYLEDDNCPLIWTIYLESHKD